MIWTVVRVGLLRMWHGRVELLLTFAVPIAFFTVFAFIFDEQIGLGKSPRVNVALVDEDGTELSRELITALTERETLRIYSPTGQVEGPLAFDAVGPARELVLGGGVPLAVVIPSGWTASLNSTEENTSNIQILADTSDPVATQVVSAMIQQVAGRLLAERTGRQIQSILLPGLLSGETPLQNDTTGSSRSGTPSLSPALLGALAAARNAGPVDVEVIDLLAADKANPVVSMYASGIAVMFLLFGAVGNAGTLLEEEESQTMERLMCSQLGMTQLLLGKWLLLLIVGIVQVTVMFAWAQLAFGVDLVGHLPGFTVMTAVTAGAAGSFALTLAALCKTRVQLNAVAIIVILCMSALGGSMVPRYVMSETMKEFGRVTFNAWALDGYTKVFWRDLPVRELLPELSILISVSLVLLIVARLLARRWESG
jgi:ABC-2 type transport system permease protein